MDDCREKEKEYNKQKIAILTEFVDKLNAPYNIQIVKPEYCRMPHALMLTQADGTSITLSYQSDTATWTAQGLTVCPVWTDGASDSDDAPGTILAALAEPHDCPMHLPIKHKHTL